MCSEKPGVTAVALGFVLLVALVNFRGMGESVKANVVLTLSGLLLMIFVGLYAISGGNADFSEVVIFDSGSEKSAFFAMVALILTGLGLTGVIHVLVSITAVGLLPVGDLSDVPRARR